MNQKVLVTDHCHKVLRDGLGQLGYDVIFEPDFNPVNLAEAVVDLTGIVINSKIKMTAEIIDQAKNLKFIGRLGSGLEIIDLDYARTKGIKVFNSPEGNRNAVAEHVMGMLLCLCNNLLRSDKEVRHKIWKREANRGMELSGKTIGIIGLGNTGSSLARKLSGWALDVIYYDPYVLNTPEELNYISKVGLETICERADIISLHVPLTEETRWMVDEEFLSKCKESLILINTSRGNVVKTSDLVKHLESGRIKGACLDVFENEKPHQFTSEEDQLYSKIYAMDNVVLSPHIAGWTHESLFKIGDVLLSKISTV
ncbi:MAG: hypothetical protein HKN67_03520 [Saprospiraceae bacterium]|nr:hypothetical protein [Saprospiraceae bacterium]